MQKPCRFGDRCTKSDACLFIHHAEVRSNGGRDGNNSNGDSVGNWGEFEEILGRIKERERRQVQQVGNGYMQGQSGKMIYQMRNGRSDGLFGHPATHLERPDFSNSGVSNYGVLNPTPHSSFDGFSNIPRGQTGVQNCIYGESGIIPSGRMKLCRNGQQCNVNGCTFSHNTINKKCRSGADCHRGNKCLFVHENLPTHHTHAYMGNNMNNINDYQVRSKNGYGRAS